MIFHTFEFVSRVRSYLSFRPVSRFHVGRGMSVAVVLVLVVGVLPLVTAGPAFADTKVPVTKVTDASQTPEALVTPEGKVRFGGWETVDKTTDGAMANINAKVVGSTTFWRHGYTGDGVTVALIDTGVAPVEGLTAAGKVINGPDLSIEAGYENLRYLDAYGHGTHLAGIIAGRDDEASLVPNERDSGDGFLGVAPGARILNVKVGDATGAADVSQ